MKKLFILILFLTNYLLDGEILYYTNLNLDIGKFEGLLENTSPTNLYRYSKIIKNGNKAIFTNYSVNTVWKEGKKGKKIVIDGYGLIKYTKNRISDIKLVNENKSYHYELTNDILIVSTTNIQKNITIQKNFNDNLIESIKIIPNKVIEKKYKKDAMGEIFLSSEINYLCDYNTYLKFKNGEDILVYREEYYYFDKSPHWLKYSSYDNKEIFYTQDCLFLYQPIKKIQYCQHICYLKYHKKPMIKLKEIEYAVDEEKTYIQKVIVYNPPQCKQRINYIVYMDKDIITQIDIYDIPTPYSIDYDLYTLKYEQIGDDYYRSYYKNGQIINNPDDLTDIIDSLIYKIDFLFY